MIKKIGIAVIALFALVLLMAATAPDNFVVQRSLLINAPPERVFALIDDFHGWSMWSPYEKLDPGMKRTFEGPASGKGAGYGWEGNSKVGAGHMEILDDVPGSKVTIKLDFVKPFEGHNTAEFTMEPQGAATNVTWAMRGPSPFFAKVMHLFFKMDAIVGKDFESGLANLKKLTEK